MNIITHMKSQLKKMENPRGFTLLELLIVISIIAILSVALVLVLNPAETLKKARDSQRIADLNTLKTALGIYVTSTTTPYLGSNTANTACQATLGIWNGTSNKMFYSLPSGSGTITGTVDGAAVATNIAIGQAVTPGLTDSNGWIPVNFDSLTGGSPISNLPVDPVNTVATLSAATSTDLVYRYACAQTPLSFEIDAALESNAFTVADNKRTSDGGNNSNFYEVGTNLRIIGTGTGF